MLNELYDRILERTVLYTCVIMTGNILSIMARNIQHSNDQFII